MGRDDADRHYRTPLFDALVTLADARKVSFHTPGHKSGKGIATRFVRYAGPKIFAIDLTTLDEVDSLLHPRGVIKEAQELAAAAFGAQASYFLVNGTTCGNHAMVLATVRPGDVVLLPRTAHRSLIAGIILAGATPVFMAPVIDPGRQVVMNVTPGAVAQALAAHPEARALVLTTPTYYGVTTDLAAIAQTAHARGVPVLVDEAHGPHLSFHPELPRGALACAADLVVQSTHKILGSMTQSSMLHVGSDRIDLGRVEGALRMVQSTSPSYVLMASLDLARMQMATEGRKLIGKALDLACQTRERINAIAGLTCWTRDEVTAFSGDAGGPAFDLDETKVTIEVGALGLTGYAVSQMLNHRFDIQAEMADPRRVLVIVSLGDRDDDLDRLVHAFEEIAAEHGRGATRRLAVSGVPVPTMPEAAVMPPREAFFAPKCLVPLKEAIGEVSGEIVTVYPPGIPLLVPGERVTAEMVEYIEAILVLGGVVDGVSAGDGHAMSVVEGFTAASPSRR